MRLRHAAVLPIAAFLICILLCAFIVQNQTQTLLETRRSALVTALSHENFESLGAGGVAEVLSPLELVGGLGAVDKEKGLNLILSEQSVTVGNNTLWGWPASFYNLTVNDLYVSYLITRSLKSLGALDGVNRTALIDVVVSRYNISDGAFHEPIITGDIGAGERNYTVCAFRLNFHGDSDTAYAHSNIISTFLAVSILSDLNALDAINTTRTLNYILSCEAENGAFQPFPGAQEEFLPGWSSLIVNPFPVDGNGTGLPYTFAAIGALKALHVNVQSLVDPKKIANYVLSLEEPYPHGQLRFLDIPGETAVLFAYTYYAIKTLQYVNMLGNESAVSSGVSAYILALQELTCADSWPVPTRQGANYGVFPDMNVLETTYFAVDILDATSNLHLLDELAPIVSATWTDLIELSILTSISAAAIVFLTLSTHWRLKAWKRRKEAAEASHQQSPALAQSSQDLPFHLALSDFPPFSSS
jgi:hypothetical protein